MSSDPLFPCCQSSVAGTSRFGIRSHALRYSDLAIPSSLKLLAHAHSRDLVHHFGGQRGEVGNILYFPVSLRFSILRSTRTSLIPKFKFKFLCRPRNSQSHKSGRKPLARLGCPWQICLRAERSLPPPSSMISLRSWSDILMTLTSSSSATMLLISKIASEQHACTPASEQNSSGRQQQHGWIKLKLMKISRLKSSNYTQAC